MSLTSFFLALTVGRVATRYRTLGQWSRVYKKIIDGRPIAEKTKDNRRCSLSHMLESLGSGRTICSVRPHEISSMVMGIHKAHPPLAKRVLIETKDVFQEAVNYGWLDRSPALAVKAPLVKVQRQRLSFEQWQAIYSYAQAHMPPWVSRMMVLALVSGQRRSDIAKMRFGDVWDGLLHIEQEKTGARLALPLDLRLDAIGKSLGDAIEDCRDYYVGDEFLIRKHNGKPPVLASLSARFEEAREGALPDIKSSQPPSLHECRSLSERLYRAQGINTMTLLGHKHQSMTDVYNDDRGLSFGQWKTLSLPNSKTS
jgi:integrase